MSIAYQANRWSVPSVRQAGGLITALLVSIMVMGIAFPVLAKVVPPNSSISVEMRKGQIIQLPRPAASVLIADPEIADVQVKSPTLLYVFGRQSGETTLYAMDDRENSILAVNVIVTHNLSGLRRAIKSALPGLDISLRSFDGGIVMEGHVSSPAEAADVHTLVNSYLGANQSVLNRLIVDGSDQVLLRVRVAEVARSELKQFGIHMENLFNAGSFAFGVATGRDLVNAATGMIGRVGDANSVYVDATRGSASFNGVIDALEQEGFVTILAEPTLVAKSGETANFLAGGEFPIPVSSNNGEVTIEFREFGVGLDFSPTVLSDKRINLHVAPEVSVLSQNGAVILNGFSVPALSTRRADTTVELASGQSFAIAGLLQNDTGNEFDKFPGLGEIPILGALFRSSRFERNETELVIVVTPYVVRGVPEEEIQTPLDGFVPPSDAERLLLGKLYHEYDHVAGQSDSIAKLVQDESLPRLHGPVGFVVE